MDDIQKDENELILWCDNTQEIYRHLQAVRANLRKKQRQGKYEHHLAWKAFIHPVNAGAKSYHKWFGYPVPWFRVFDAKTRQAVAWEYVKQFGAEDE